MWTESERVFTKKKIKGVRHIYVYTMGMRERKESLINRANREQ